jgi:hypothetical protein
MGNNKDPVWFSFPQAFGERQPCEIFGDERPIRADAETFENGDQLASVLRGVPGGTLEKLVHWRGAVESFHGLAAGFVFKLGPPGFQPCDRAFAVGGNFHSRRAGAVCRWHVGVVSSVLDVVNGSFEEGLADAKDVMAQKSDRAIAIVDGALFESLVGELADVALGGAKYVEPFRHQFGGGQRRMAAALQADKLGDVFQVLAKNILLAIGQNRNRARTEFDQPPCRDRIVQDIEGGEGYAFFRKKLFRSQATASPGLGEENKCVVGVFHDSLLKCTV